MEITPFKRFIITLTVISASIIELIDTSIVNVALSQISGNLGATIEDVSWVITSYAIANVIIIPMTGFLAQYFGRKNYYLVSIALFTIASLMCGTAGNLWTLVFWRFMQGIGGGALLSTSQSILYDAWPTDKRSTASALYGMGIIIGPTIGPTLGGYIVDNFTWNLCFTINIPIGIIALLLTWTFVEKQVHELHIDRSKISIDYIGIVLLAIGIGALQFVLERGEAEDWFESKAVIWLTIAAVLGLGLFIWWELRVAHPVVNLRVLKNRNLAVSNFLTLVTGFGMFSFIFVFPVLAQRVLGYTPTITGLYLLPGAVAALFLMPIIGRSLQAGLPPLVFVIGGFIFFTLAGITFSHSDPNADGWFFFFPLIFRGLGTAMLTIPLVNQAAMGLKPQEMPQGLALTNMMRQLGGSMGIAMVNTYTAMRFAVHRGDLITHIRLDDQSTIDRINSGTQALLAKGLDFASAQAASIKMIDLSVNKQAYLQSYNDALLLVSIFFLLCFPLVFLLQRKSTMNAAAMKAAAEAAH